MFIYLTAKDNGNSQLINTNAIHTISTIGGETIVVLDDITPGNDALVFKPKQSMDEIMEMLSNGGQLL